MFRRHRTLALLIILSFLALSTSVFAEGQVIRYNSEQLRSLNKAFVNYVYDGDTIRTADGDKIRMIGVDTPEMNWDEGEADFYAREALDFTKEKLLAKHVYLEYDKEYRDRYGRILAYLFLADGTMFNELLLREGYAALLEVDPNRRYSEIFKAAVEEARVSSLGIWNRWQELEEILPLISWQQVDKYLGKDVIVQGEIVNIYDTEEIIFLEFDKKEEDAFKLLIFKHSLNRFAYNPLDELLDKQIMVSGKIVDYKGQLEIIVNSPLEIKIL